MVSIGVESMEKNLFSRRSFLRTTAGVAGASIVAGHTLLEPEPWVAAANLVGANDRIRFGIVGVGMEGSGLLSTAIQLPGVECVAAADLYDRRHDLAKEIAGKGIRTTRRYQELLDAKDIDAILVAVPDHWHKQVVVDALAAGKDVYCEKPMSHNPADGLAMVAAQKKTDRIVQIGAQRTSSVLCAKAKELLEQGAIGDLNLMRLRLGATIPMGHGSIRFLRAFAGESGLGYVAGYGAEEGIRSICVCALAVLEGVWDRSCGRPAGSPDQRDAFCAWHQRGAEARFIVWRDLSVQGRPQYAGCAPGSV